jgi:hypothetical protein
MLDLSDIRPSASLQRFGQGFEFGQFLIEASGG